MADTLREVLSRFSHGDVSSEDAIRAVLRHAGWRVEETVEFDDGIPMSMVESEGGDLTGAAVLERLEPDTGVAFDPDEEWAMLFRPAQLPVLRRWAAFVALEDALLRPGPAQADLLRTGPWFAVVTPGTRIPAVHRADELDVVTVLTAPDAMKTFVTTEAHRQLEVAELGPELWQGLAARTDFDAVRVNPLRPGSQLLPPHFPAALAAGRDARPGAEPLAARTVAEIHLWLDHAGARSDPRSHRMVSGPAGLVALYSVQFDYDRRDIPFAPVEPTPDPLDYGDGPTHILCAGLLLRRARVKLGGLPSDPSTADAAQRQRAAQAARWLFELSKLAEGGSVPFSALRTPEGARLWHVEPEAFTAEAIRTLHERAEALAGTV